MINSAARGVLELVMFRLKDGATEAAFLETEPAMSRWIAEQPGYVSHDLLKSDDDHTWVFIGWWRGMGEAKAAALAAETADGCAPMFALIDMANMIYLHAVQVAAAA